ncbi:MAG: nucleotidyltransferase domain-containing protein [Leptospiraceae bacterium]|nr:nucleotidyltransferase domain-containing protein [Leptospiraceae bacterium]
MNNELYIITTVGTSIFTNFFKYYEIKDESPPSEFKDIYRDLDKCAYSIDDWRKSENDRNVLKNNNDFKAFYKDNDNASAEIKSINKIIEKNPNKNINIHLLATETVLSRLASEIIMEVFAKENINITFSENDIIPNLKVSFDNLKSEEEKEVINQGFENFIQKLYTLITDYKNKGKVILNISGGYKALTPFTTIIGQLEQVPLNYIYEDSNTLIEINPIPINFDIGIAELYLPYLEDASLSDPQTIPLVAKKNLENWKLIQINEEGLFKKTILGELLLIYFDSNASLSKKSLGFFVEYKVFEYFANRQYHSLDETKFCIVKLGEKIKSKSYPNPEEIDILLFENQEKTNSKVVFIEIKSLSQSFKEDGIIARMKKRYEIAREKNWNLIEYSLIVYFPNFENIRDKIAIYKKYKREAEVLGIQFRVFYFNVPISNEQVHYQNFLQNKLNELCELSLFDEVMDSLRSVINQALEIITSSGNPLKVYLFGSAARRQMHKDSDLDFYIIEESNGEEKNRAAKYYKSLHKLIKPKDIIVRTIDEFENNKKKINALENDVFYEGILLYEK